MAYASFASDGFAQGARNGAVADMQSQIGNEWVGLSIFEYQSTLNSHDIAPNTTGVNPRTGSSWPMTSTLQDIRLGIADVRSHGMKAMLKPHLDIYSGEWRGGIVPDTSWFSAYAAMMLKYARLADSLEVELFCIGTELVGPTQPSCTQSWRSLIANIRLVYSGKLTYAANWSGTTEWQSEFEQVQFWNDLDYIGIDAYWPLTNVPEEVLPTFDAAYSRMRTATAKVGFVASTYNRQVLITETGIQSTRGALAQPWKYSLGSSPTALQDLDAQDLYYRVVIKAIAKQSWCDGVFWWNWESVPTSNAATNYTPRNKPAASSVRLWYQSNSFTEK